MPVKPIVRIPQGSIDIKEEYFTGDATGGAQAVTLKHIPMLPLIRVEKWNATDTAWEAMTQDSTNEYYKYSVSGTRDAENTIITFGARSIPSSPEDNIHVVYEVGELTVNTELLISATDMVVNVEESFSKAGSPFTGEKALIGASRHPMIDLVKISDTDLTGTDWSIPIVQLTDIAINTYNISTDTTLISDNTFSISDAVWKISDNTFNISDYTLALTGALKTVDTDEFITRITRQDGTEIFPAQEDGNLSNIATDTALIKTDTAFIKTDTAFIRTAIDEIKTDTGFIKTDTANIRTSLELIDNAVYTEGDTTPAEGILVMGSDGTYARALAVNDEGELKVNLETSDIEIGGVEIKNGTDDTRATVSIDDWGLNALHVQGKDLRDIATDTCYLNEIREAVEGIKTDTASYLGDIATDTWLIKTDTGFMKTDTAAMRTSLGLLDGAVYTEGDTTPASGLLVFGSDGTYARALAVNNEGELEVNVERPTVVIQGKKTDIDTTASQVTAASTPILKCVTIKIRNMGGATNIAFGVAGAGNQSFMLKNVDDSIDVDWIDDLNKVYVVASAGSSSKIEWIGG